MNIICFLNDEEWQRYDRMISEKWQRADRMISEEHRRINGNGGIVMKRKEVRRILAALLCVVFGIMFFSSTASADMGPKASVRIIFENMGDGLCYGTLLSKNPSTGPASVWDGNEEHAVHNANEEYSYATLDYATWKAFAEYEDSDGYYFLQEGWKVSESGKIEWIYYPPGTFKILLYYPETDTFAVSGIYEKYAFDTYYTVNMDGVDIGAVQYDEELSSNERINAYNESIRAYRSYNYRVEIFSLIARILITIAVEMGIAFLFGFRAKKQVLLLVGVNTATQILLNVLLNIINYNSGQLAFTVFYVLFELIVFAVEAVLYCIWMKKFSVLPKKSWFYIVYALVANAVSFGAGIVTARMLPGIF